MSELFKLAEDLLTSVSAMHDDLVRIYGDPATRPDHIILHLGRADAVRARALRILYEYEQGVDKQPS